MNGQSRARRYSLLFIVLVVTGSVWTGSARQGAPAQKPAAPGTSNFTGKVASVDASDLLSTRFRYEAGARSNWHVHEGALLVLVEQGRGRIQLQGQPVEDIVPGRAVLMPGGVPHWHGAAPDQGLTWIALTVGRDVKTTGPVTEDEYLGRTQ